MPRCYPTVKGWTEDLLKKRQEAEIKDGSYGKGYLDEQFEKRQDKSRAELVDGGFSERQSGKQPSDFPGNTTNLSGTNGTMKLADAVINLMHVLKDTPVEIRISESFKMIWDMLRRAFGIADTTIEQETNPVGTLTQSMSQEECHGSQWSETMDALLKGAEELLDKRHEFPSFSLGTGFTQVSIVFVCLKI